MPPRIYLQQGLDRFGHRERGLFPVYSILRRRPVQRQAGGEQLPHGGFLILPGEQRPGGIPLQAGQHRLRLHLQQHDDAGEAQGLHVGG